MHEVQGFLCKTDILWINTKIATKEKTRIGPNLVHVGPTERRGWAAAHIGQQASWGCGGTRGRARRGWALALVHAGGINRGGGGAVNGRSLTKRARRQGLVFVLVSVKQYDGGGLVAGS